MIVKVTKCHLLKCLSINDASLGGIRKTRGCGNFVVLDLELSILDEHVAPSDEFGSIITNIDKNKHVLVVSMLCQRTTTTFYITTNIIGTMIILKLSTAAQCQLLILHYLRYV